MIDQLPDQDAVEVLDSIGYLNLKLEATQGLDVEQLAIDEGFIRQVGQSREDRQAGHVYGQEVRLDYLRVKVEGILTRIRMRRTIRSDL